LHWDSSSFKIDFSIALNTKGLFRKLNQTFIYFFLNLMPMQDGNPIVLDNIISIKYLDPTLSLQIKFSFEFL